MMKKLVAMLLMLVLCMGLAVTASADQTGTTGACTWSFDEATGTLTISGSGAMADYSSSNNPPWASFKDSIQTIVINEGVTTIGNRAFPEYPALTEVFISGSVKAIGNNAFYSCSNLKTVEYCLSPSPPSCSPSGIRTRSTSAKPRQEPQPRLASKFPVFSGAVRFRTALFLCRAKERLIPGMPCRFQIFILISRFIMPLLFFVYDFIHNICFTE